MHAIFSPRFVLWLVEQIRILFVLNIDTKKNFHFNRYLPASVLMVRRNRASLLRTNYTWLWVFCASKLLSFLWANDLLFKEMMNAGRGASHWELVRLSFRLFFRNEKIQSKLSGNWREWVSVWYLKIGALAEENWLEQFLTPKRQANNVDRQTRS